MTSARGLKLWNQELPRSPLGRFYSNRVGTCILYNQWHGRPNRINLQNISQLLWTQKDKDNG